MSEAGFCPHARRAALAAYNEVEPSFPDVTVPEDQTEQYDLQNGLKPAYYGLIGQLINRVIDVSQERPLPQPRRRVFSNNSFRTLSRQLDSHLKEAVDDVMDIDMPMPYMTALSTAFPVMRRLNPARYSVLSKSAKAGAGTAAYHLVKHLDILNGFAESADIPDRIGVLRNSHNVIRRQATMNAVQLTLVNDALLNGDIPAVEYEPKAGLLRYATDPLDRTLNDADRFRVRTVTGSNDITTETIRDVSDSTDVIGCPILFEPGQLKQMWNWVIDEAVRRELVTPER